MYSVTVETERSSALCTALPWKPSGALLVYSVTVEPSGALLCVQRYRGNRAELCFVYSVTVETERSSALCTALPWKPSGDLLCVQRYRGNRAERCLCTAYRGNRAELCFVYSVTVETERSSALCTALPWKPSGALLCVQRYRGNRAELCFVYSVTVETAISPALSTSCWQRINLHIYANYIYLHIYKCRHK